MIFSYFIVWDVLFEKDLLCRFCLFEMKPLFFEGLFFEILEIQNFFSINEVIVIVVISNIQIEGWVSSPAHK